MSKQKSLLPDDWGELSPMVDRLLDASPLERPALLAELAGDNPARRAALERLVEDCERELHLVERPAIERFTHLLEEHAGPPLADIVGGRYRIERELGHGGMGRVYLAHDTRESRSVAVKVIKHEVASLLGRDRFLREIEISARMRHPNIMPLIDSGDANGVLFFVMPFEEGNSLREQLDQTPRLGIGEGVRILRDIARALAFAHERGVVHRDVKPDNVMLSREGAIVADFGVAKALTAAASDMHIGTPTQAGVVIGTPAYMAPEQAMGDPDIDHRADIYAFGCLAYEVFAGAPPFIGANKLEIVSAKLTKPLKPLREHRPDVPDAVAQLITRCLALDPDARPSRASELLNILASVSATN